MISEAKESRILSEYNKLLLDSTTSKHLTQIEEKIKKAIENGLTGISYEMVASSEWSRITSYLKMLGYKVVNTSTHVMRGMHKISVIIDWGYAE